MIQQLDPHLFVDPHFFEPDLLYPESDGKPVADNTIQFGLIMKIQGGLDSLFNSPDVFVAGDLFWYPVEGSLVRQAPDVMVVFGRPKGHRRSYKQWEEDNIAPQVVFEILSHSNTRKEMEAKFAFYEQHGVSEYYVYDPQKNRLKGWIRTHECLTAIVQMDGWTSPSMGVRFENRSGVLELYRPDGQRFESFVEISHRAEQEAQRAEQEAQARYSVIDRLVKLGLSVEQVAEALGFSVEEVNQHLVTQHLK